MPINLGSGAISGAYVGSTAVSAAYLGSTSVFSTGGGAADISGATFLQSFSVATQDGLPMDVAFKSDGSKMYVCGRFTAGVNEYDLAAGWDISTASFSQSVSTSAQADYPTGIAFKPDGTAFFLTDLTDKAVYKYTCSTAWDISTASYSQSLSVTSQVAGSLRGGGINAAGTSFYITDQSGSLSQYILSTAWDLSSATYDASLSVTSQTNFAAGFALDASETRLYHGQLVENNSTSIFEYILGTAGDITTATYNQSVSVYAKEIRATGVFIHPSASDMYVIGYDSDSVHQYSL